VPTLPLPQLTLEEGRGAGLRAASRLSGREQRLKAAEAEVTAARSGFSAVARGHRRLRRHRALGGAIAADVLGDGQVNVPLFEGGRTHGRTAQARADLAQRRAELEDLRARVYYNARLAFLDLQSAEEQVRTATRARELADLQLTQARDRFAAGVASNLEVVQAQEAVAAAAEGYIAALYDLNIAKAMVLGSPGSLEAGDRELPGGSNR
jgi:outer membrane protein TolC